MDSDKPKRYTPINLREHHFVDDVIKDRMAELRQLEGADEPNIWASARQITGIIEYCAWDLIEAQVWKYIGLHGATYEMYTDELPVPTIYHELRWSLDGRTTRMQVPTTEFQRHAGRLLTDTDRALSFLGLRDGNTSFTLMKIPGGSMWDLWHCTIDGDIAYGNLPAEAIVHAWGVSRGIWGKDRRPPKVEWKRAFTINTDGSIEL